MVVERTRKHETHHNDLGRGIVRTPATLGQKLVLALVRHHTKVDELDMQVAVDVGTDEDVLELDVAVAEAEASEVGELRGAFVSGRKLGDVGLTYGADELGKDVLHLERSEDVLVKVVEELAIRAVLHDEVAGRSTSAQPLG